MHSLFMASGKLLKNQSLLLKYFEALEKMGIDKSVSVPTSDDISFLVKAIYEGKISLLEALSALTRRFIPRVIGEAAKKAVEEVLGEEVDTILAREIIAKDLAAWTIEIADRMHLIKLNLSILK
ncbi:MAG: hypothetical protein QW775_06705 [Ignisphaera sp.]|uniref:Uncharacterized protein n=1 Tax=Ignisphaera aggregans TaxID=334771 RepID=A0A7C4NL39_9CREN